MLACRAVNVSASSSLGNFFKHFPIAEPASLHRRVRSRALNTTVAVRYSLFEALSSRQQDQIRVYVDTLLQWNQKMNLTAVKDANSVMERHIEDSLAILPPLKSSYISYCDTGYERISIVDVGSGAGLPGLVMAIACPGWKITLVESISKRCLFLEHVVSVIDLSNVQIVRGRAESLGQDLCYRERYDVAVARAVAEMRVLAEYCLPLVRVGGLFVAAKGHDPQDEARDAERAVQLMGATMLQLCPVDSHSPYGQRTAIVCLKRYPTPENYPRDPGTPAKIPL